MSLSTRQRVQKRREALRAAGLRPVQIWIPDIRRPGFAAECRRQSRLAAEADAADPGLEALLDAALADLGADLDAGPGADRDADRDADRGADREADPGAAPERSGR